MESNEKGKSTSRSIESQNKTPSQSQLEVIQKNKTSIEFQENEPDVTKESFSINPGDEDDQSREQQKENFQPAGDEDDQFESLQKIPESTEDYDENDHTGEHQETPQTTKDDNDQSDSQQQEIPESAEDYDDNDQTSQQQETPQTTGDNDDDDQSYNQQQRTHESTEGADDRTGQQQETSQTTGDDDDHLEYQQQETSQTTRDDDDHLEDQQQESPPFTMVDEGGDSEDAEKVTTEEDENSAEYERFEEQAGDSAQDVPESTEKSALVSEGSKAKEMDDMLSSSETRKFSKKVLPDLPSSDIIIDEATLTRSIESIEQVSQEPVDSEKSQKDRKVILPSISSSGIIVDQELEAESETIQPPAEFASSLFSTVLLVQPRLDERYSTVLKQSDEREVSDRGFTIESTEEDIKTYFLKKPVSLLRKSTLKPGKKPVTKLSGVKSSASKMDEKESSSKVETGGLAFAPSDLCSEWEPMIDEPKVGYHYRMQSWVGSYIIGFDYWAKKEEQPKENKEVTYNMDEKDAWYDISLKEAKSAATSIEKKREAAKKKFEIIKMKGSRENKRPTRVGKVLPGSHDPKDQVDEHMKQDLHDMFIEFARNDKKTERNRMSLKCADNWLEKVGLLDYRHLTLIHTGLCFKAAGGSRYRGLTFEEFFVFVEMIAETRKMPMQHMINRLKLAVLEN